MKWWKWWVLATIVSADNVIVGVAASHLSSFGAAQVLLSQARIPISMATTLLLVRGVAYQPSQYVGAVVVLLGILAALLPDTLAQIQGDSDEFSAALPWMGVYLLHCIPNALAAVYQEAILKDVEGGVDPYFANAMIQIPSVIATLALLVPSALLDSIAVSDLGSNLARGAQCEFGVTPDGDTKSCTLAPVFTHLFIVVNTGWNVMFCLILASAGANVNFLISTLTLPIAACVFALPFVPNHKPVTGYTFLGLFLIVVGLSIYSRWNEMRDAAERRFPAALACINGAAQRICAACKKSPPESFPLSSGNLVDTAGYPSPKTAV